MVDRILNVTLHNNLFHLVHTNAASVLHSITPGTQGPTHPLGRQSKHESCMMKCPFGFESAKTISPILNSPRFLFSTNNIRKKDEIPCHHPPLKIKYCKRQNFKTRPPLSPDQIKTLLTLNHTSPFPQTSPGGP